ncbi:hypothetical protein AMC90_CH01581 [Rhizobium phaseoli]|nr:hypothetical protein AMC90_CH01581 [Rhizobium phaseoli]ANL65311.1 hypothetical protein AMC84_CH01633 [Rhizobium phaseoli]ANL78125.1 hypothetical protein AMC82_CH01628 [Rhizobium phaseoli]ANM03724.1 hypothetical protein AMC78_CH01596 [Rhizobium phaseoli]
MKGDSSLRHRDLLRDKAIERESHLIERAADTESMINHQVKLSERFLAVVRTIRRDNNLARI